MDTEATKDRTGQAGRWALVQERFSRLRAHSWPTPPRQPATAAERAALAEQAHFNKWREILRPWAAFEEADSIKDHVNLLAYRFTRLLAMASQTVSRYGPLSQVPCQPNGWTLPLPAQTHPILIPDGLTLDPRHCDPELFSRALHAAAHLFSHMLHSPMHMVAEWLTDPEDPARLHFVWPGPASIVRFERDLIYWVQNLVRLKGRFKAMQKAQDHFDLSVEETAVLCNQSLATYRELGRIDPEIERGLLLARAENYLARMRKGSLDPKNELAAMKLIAAITGLTRGVEKTRDDGNLDMIDVIAEVFKQDDAPPALPGPPP